MYIGRILVFAILLGVTLAACSSEGDSGGGDASAPETTDDFTPVIAKVGDMEITQGFFDKRYRQLSATGKTRFSGEDWRQRFLDELVEEAVIYQQALAEDYDKWPEVQARIEMARRSILVNAYTDDFQRTAVPTDEQIAEHWELRKEEYRELDRAVAYHIRCQSKEKIEEAYSKLQAGEDFEQVAWQYDEDPNSHPNKGLIGWVNPDGYVLGLGYNKQFTDTLFELEPRQYSKPMEISGNWHIIRVGAKKQGDLPTMEEARDRIIENIRPRIAFYQYGIRLKELEKEYGVEYFGEFKDHYTQTPEQLYLLASEATNPYARVEYYRILVTKHVDSEYTDDSLFMLGFIYSEELYEAPTARNYLNRLLNEYPDSPYAEDALWLKQNLGGAIRDLKEANAPSAREVLQNIRDQQK